MKIKKLDSIRGVQLSAVMAIVVVLGLMMLAPTVAQEGTTTRPISDFVDAQGTFCWPPDAGQVDCKLWVPPVENFIGWSELKKNIAISVDYAGLANKVPGMNFGTTTDGTVTERALDDGRAEVTVLLHTKNALTWAIAGDGNGNFDYGSGPLLFGERVGGVNPALGESFLQVKFINNLPGAPLPDLEQLFMAPLPGQEFPSFLSFRAQADGEFPDGTPGRIEVVQTGLFMTKYKGATADGFPAEQINLNVVGK